MMQQQEAPEHKESVRTRMEPDNRQSTNTYFEQKPVLNEDANHYPIPEEQLSKEYEDQKEKINQEEEEMLDYPTKTENEEEEFVRCSMNSFMILSELKTKNNK